jgi:hypothetical protein
MAWIIVRELETSAKAHFAHLGNVVRKREGVRSGQIANAQAGGAPEMVWIAPEDRASTLVAQKEGRLAELVQEPVTVLMMDWRGSDRSEVCSQVPCHDQVSVPKRCAAAGRMRGLLSGTIVAQSRCPETT